MPKITACIISFNEQAKIEACLESVKDIVDEIIVVDSHSTDNTQEIARRFTPHVISQDWLGMGAQKALAYSKASHDWILNLDCDERVTGELAHSIQAIRESEPQPAAYEFTRRNFYVYRWLDHCWYPEWRTRLFDRKRCEVRGTDPHEYVHVLEGSTGRLQGDLEHYSFDSIDDHLRTINSYTSTAADELEAKGKSVSMLQPFTRGLWTFVRLYLLKRGFLDGFAGLCVSLLSAVHTFLKYAKVLTRRWARRNAAPQDVPASTSEKSSS